MAVLLRLCEADRAKYPGGDEEGWVRFDEAALDDIPWATQYGWETGGLGFSIDWLLDVDWPSKSTRGKAGLVWLARMMADIETPPLAKFEVNTRRIEIKHEKPARTRRVKGSAEEDAVPPGVAPSSEDGASVTA